MTKYSRSMEEFQQEHDANRPLATPQQALEQAAAANPDLYSTTVTYDGHIDGYTTTIRDRRTGEEYIIYPDATVWDYKGNRVELRRSDEGTVEENTRLLASLFAADPYSLD